MIILRQKSFFDNEEKKPSIKKDTKRLVSGIASGSILGASTGKFFDTVDKKDDIVNHLYKNPEKASRLKRLTGNNKRLQQLVIDEAASVITPNTIKRVKKGAKLGAIGGGLLTGTNLVRKRLQKEYSDLPNDWNEKDDKYISLVEKAKKRNREISNNLNRDRDLIYTGIGTSIGLVSGLRRGRLYKNSSSRNLIGKPKFKDKHPRLIRTVGDSIKGGAIGASISTLGGHFTELTTNGKVSQENLRKLNEKENISTDKVLRKYKKMKTSKERDAFRKKIGVKF